MTAKPIVAQTDRTPYINTVHPRIGEATLEGLLFRTFGEFCN